MGHCVLLGVPSGIHWGLDQGSYALTRAQAEHRLVPLRFLNELSPATQVGAPSSYRGYGGVLKEFDSPPNKFTAAPGIPLGP